MHPLLNKDLLGVVAGHLDASTLGRCCRVCRAWRAAFSTSPRWVPFLADEFGVAVAGGGASKESFGRAAMARLRWRHHRGGVLSRLPVALDEDEALFVSPVFAALGERLLVQESDRSGGTLCIKAGLADPVSGRVDRPVDCSYSATRRVPQRRGGADAEAQLVVVTTQSDGVVLERGWERDNEDGGCAVQTLPLLQVELRRGGNLEAAAALGCGRVLVASGRVLRELCVERAATQWAAPEEEVEETQCLDESAAQRSGLLARRVAMPDVARELCPLRGESECAAAVWSSGQVGWFDARVPELLSWNLPASLHEAVSGCLSPDDRHLAVCLRRVVRLYDVRAVGRVLATGPQGARRCRFVGRELVFFMGDLSVAGYDLRAAPLVEQPAMLAPLCASPQYHGCGPSLEAVGGRLFFADFDPGHISVFEPEKQ
jgi:hypothetical protein